MRHHVESPDEFIRQKIAEWRAVIGVDRDGKRMSCRFGRVDLSGFGLFILYPFFVSG